MPKPKRSKKKSGKLGLPKAPGPTVLPIKVKTLRTFKPLIVQSPGPTVGRADVILPDGPGEPRYGHWTQSDGGGEVFIEEEPR